MPKRARITLIVAALVLSAAGVALMGVYEASQQVPAFYNAAVAVEPDRQLEDRDAFVAQATALASDLHAEGHWQSLFTAEQINAWLALELANNYPDLLPDELRDPRISLSKDGATIGCQYHSGDLSTVVSISLEAFLQQPNVVAVRIRQARAGALPVPLGHILDSITHAAHQLNLRLEWRKLHGDPVALITLPHLRNGNSDALRLESLEIRNGELFVSGTVGPPPLETTPIVPEPLRVPTAQLEELDHPRIGSAETDTIQK